MRIVLVGCVLAIAGAARAAFPDLPASQLASPDTSAPVQFDSVFAPVVAATPAIGVHVRRVFRPNTDTATDAIRIPLDGAWRFRLESTDCSGDETQCEGILGRWFEPDYDDSAWRELVVPGHFIRQISVDELGGRASTLPFNFAWYRRVVTLPDDVDVARQRLRLLFEAVDYRADVWFDGVLLTTLGSHVGTFNPFAFDLSSTADRPATPSLPGRANHVVVVRVLRPLDAAILSCGGSSGAATDLKTVIDGTKGYWDGRPGGNSDNFDPVTKQSLHTGGIVRPVALTASGAVRLDWVFVTALPNGDDRADVLLAYTLSNLEDVPVDADLVTAIGGPGLGPDGGVRARARLHPGANRIELATALHHVSLWFPAGHPELGGPVLYTADTTVSVRQRVSDHRRDRFGIRSLAYLSDRCEDRFAGQPPDPACADSFDYTAPRAAQGVEPDRPIQQRFINGKRIFVAGAAVDPNAWVATIDRPFSDQYMRLVRSINANQVGMAVQIAPPVFYDAADEAGVTVVQDFELQWSYNDSGYVFACRRGGTPVPVEFDRDDIADHVVETASLLAADEIYLLYNHPSIVHWVMHNEPTWELAEVLGDYVPAVRALATFNRRLDSNLVAIATAIDRTRPVKAAAGVGDTHAYSGYLLCSFYDLLGRDPGRTLCNAESAKPIALLTEFGSQVWPFSAKRWMGPAILFPPDRDVRRQTWTDATPTNPAELVPWLREWLYHTSTVSQLAAYIGSPADYDRFQDFALASQLYQRTFLDFYIRHLRKDRFRPTAGLRFFQLRDYWDQAYFGVFDQRNVAAAAVAAIRDAYAPVLVTSEVVKPYFAPAETIRLPVWIANDLHREVRGATLTWRLTQISDSYVLRGVVDFLQPPFQDARRLFLGVADSAPPQPVITTVPRPGATRIGPPLMRGRRLVRIPPDSVSPPEGEVTVSFAAPAGPEPLRNYLLELELRRGREVLSRNAHLIVVANPGWDPPPGLSDGVTAYGTDPGDRQLAFRLIVRGLQPGTATTVEVPQFGGATEEMASTNADEHGTAIFTNLVPDEYVIRAAGIEVGHVGLTEDSTLVIRDSSLSDRSSITNHESRLPHLPPDVLHLGSHDRLPGMRARLRNQGQRPGERAFDIVTPYRALAPSQDTRQADTGNAFMEASAAPLTQRDRLPRGYTRSLVLSEAELRLGQTAEDRRLHVQARSSFANRRERGVESLGRPFPLFESDTDHPKSVVGCAPRKRVADPFRDLDRLISVAQPRLRLSRVLREMCREVMRPSEHFVFPQLACNLDGTIECLRGAVDGTDVNQDSTTVHGEKGVGAQTHLLGADFRIVRHQDQRLLDGLQRSVERADHVPRLPQRDPRRHPQGQIAGIVGQPRRFRDVAERLVLFSRHPLHDAVDVHEPDECVGPACLLR